TDPGVILMVARALEFHTAAVEQQAPVSVELDRPYSKVEALAVARLIAALERGDGRIKMRRVGGPEQGRAQSGVGGERGGFAGIDQPLCRAGNRQLAAVAIQDRPTYPGALRSLPVVHYPSLERQHCLPR